MSSRNKTSKPGKARPNLVIVSGTTPNRSGQRPAGKPGKAGQAKKNRPARSKKTRLIRVVADASPVVTQQVAKKQTSVQSNKNKRRGRSGKNKQSSILKTVITGQIHNDAKKQCVNPITIALSDSDQIIPNLFVAIDAFIFGAMADKPNQFMSQETTIDYPIKINVLRGMWFFCFQHYMNKCQSLSQFYSAGSEFGGIKIPFGLAKIFQQFAPYVDMNTGSTYKNQFDFYDPNINTAYNSVDVNTAGTPWTNLNAPLARYLIHPSQMLPSGHLVEYGTLGSKGVQTFPTPVLVPFSEFWTTFSGDEKARMQNLFAGGIEVNSIIPAAPDASTYCSRGMSGWSSPIQNFRSDMASICRAYYVPSGTSIDYESNFCFDRPYTVCRWVDTAGHEGAITAGGYCKTLLQNYVFLTSKCTKYANGPGIDLMKHVPSFSTLKDFSYRAVPIDMNKFAKLVLSAYKTVPWNAAANNINNSFAYTSMCWSMLLTRVLPMHYINTVSSVTNDACFHADSSVNANIRLPVSIVRAVSGIGPVVVDGRVVMPYLGTGYCSYNSPTPTDRTWQTAVSVAGIWNSSAITFGMGAGVTGIATLQLKTPPNGVNWTRTDPTDVVYSANFATLSTFWTKNYQGSLPPKYISESLPTVINCLLGDLNLMLGNNTSVLLTSDSIAWTGTVLQSTGAYNLLNSVSQLCSTAEDLTNIGIFGILANPTDEGWGLRPTKVATQSQTVEPAFTLQNANNGTTENSFTSIVRADITTNTMKQYKNKPTVDVGYVTAVLIVDSTIRNAAGDMFRGGSGERAGALSWIKQFASHPAVKQVANNLIAKAVTYVSQNMEGGTNYTKRYNMLVGNKKEQPKLLTQVIASDDTSSGVFN